MLFLLFPFCQLFRSLKLGNQYSINQEYVESFKQADQTFLYQTVFDPQLETLVPLTAIPEELESLDLEFLGPYPFVIYTFVRQKKQA